MGQAVQEKLNLHMVYRSPSMSIPWNAVVEKTKDKSTSGSPTNVRREQIVGYDDMFTISFRSNSEMAWDAIGDSR